ncbi:MAG: hypothetical protein Q9190_005603 [Brigantiaea leucoxantha]
MFGPVAQIYAQEVDEFSHGLNYSLNKCDFISIYQKAKNQAFSQKNILYAWENAGLIPLNPEKVLCKIPKAIPAATERLVTPKSLEIRFTDSTGAESSVPITPVNTRQIQEAMDTFKLTNDIVIFEKVCKTAQVFISRSVLAELRADDLRDVAHHEAEKRARKKGGYGKARVLDIEEIDRREKKEAQQAKEKQEMKQAKKQKKEAKDNKKLTKKRTKELAKQEKKFQNAVKPLYLIQLDAYGTLQKVDDYYQTLPEKSPQKLPQKSAQKQLFEGIPPLPPPNFAVDLLGSLQKSPRKFPQKSPRRENPPPSPLPPIRTSRSGRIIKPKLR